MCWHDDDGGFTDNIYGDDIDATIYDIRRKEREEEALIKEIEESENEDGHI